MFVLCVRLVHSSRFKFLEPERSKTAKSCCFDQIIIIFLPTGGFFQYVLVGSSRRGWKDPDVGVENWLFSTL